ncbi:ATPase family AAA domain-containing protein 5 isoform X2 [Gouania willdenowi]|uniref:ATPase family AAA domain-containing protein 5 isoform X2 n=1 Tax=Gouania willdenowi TaxID=441366 RepID=UPI001054688A|nr:ATPase family AAA domain-containing protein 5-like isoform X2 [Gouania willdenowi]
MAGVVAMASIIEDFDTQPCKKSRKDVGSPVVKTITNYFSPVAKPIEKPFSPPRSNNIMDYFNKKAPLSKEKSNIPEQSKENCQRPPSAEKQSNPVVEKPATQKQGRKASKMARKRLVTESVESTKEDSCVIIEELCKSKDTGAAHVSIFSVFGSDTATLLAQTNAEISPAKANSDDEVEKVDLRESSKEIESVSNIIELSPIVPSGNKPKLVKTCAQKVKKRQQEKKHSEPKESEADSSLCDVSMEVNLDEASQLNSSTVTISFEEFVRSQSREEDSQEDVKENQGKGYKTAVTTELEDVDAEALESPKAGDNISSGEPSDQVSPRTVTIQAEVHAISPKQEAASSMEKLAPIFNRKKTANSPTKVTSSPQAEIGQLSPSVKHKSNVVLLEEDLELVVIESESPLKCSDIEKKQFMAAFKQPNMDHVSKGKAVKSQTKQKPEEENVDAADESVKEPCAVKVSQSSTENKQPTKKPTRKRKNRIKATKKEKGTISPPAEDMDTKVIEDDNKNKGSPSSTPTLRRSRRERPIHAPEASPSPPVRTTRRQNDSKPVSDVTQDSPGTTSTPKTRKSKRGLFVAQMMCAPDAKGSPIRIKLTRVTEGVSPSKSKSKKVKSPLTKTTTDVRKRKQAKKLVEDSKVIQMKKTCKEKVGVRRSSRSEASIKRSYCESEDLIICVDEDQTKTPLKAPAKSKNQKGLRSLNDVLGKDASAGKEAKATSVTSLDSDKTARKVTAVISIFDDSSREGSENSQDDEQFRARREFLKSGLPESFRKQIAKTAATKEEYSLCTSDFQPVTHTTQPPKDERLWKLPWPESSQLFKLKDVWRQTPNHTSPVCASLCVKTLPAGRSFAKRVLGSRPEISESNRHLLMEEVSRSNPQFPAQRFISCFLKRRTEYQQQLATAEAEAVVVTNTVVQSGAISGKRKRTNDEVEISVKEAKKQRSNQPELNHPTAQSGTNIRAGRSRRSRRSRSKEEEAVEDKTKPSLRAAPIPPQEEAVVILDDLEEDAGKKDVVREDVLWTDKYQPQHSSDIVGNAASVRRLHSWLKEWKRRADREERKKQKEKKQEVANSDSDWDCGDEDDVEDLLCNTMIITGPTGVGKTAAVYACAQELGFKVFEVNASSQRSGRLILSQLKEATQSHQVDSQGVNAHKPTYFNAYGASSGGSSRPGSSPRKGVSPRRVVSSPRKNPQSPRAAKRGSLAPTSLSNYFFKMGKATNKQPPNNPKADHSVSKGKEGKQKGSTIVKKKQSEEQAKKTATSLILFEEVDVIFEDDSGFLAAIKTFMTTTKRPVILTTSDPSFSSTFDGNFEEIRFDTPSVLNVSSYLQLLCLAEDTRTDGSDICALLRLNGCDIRQSLLQLQFWTRSSGGQQPAEQPEQNKENEDNLLAEIKDKPLPLCESGCIKSKLGLLNIESERDMWELLKSQSLLEEKCWDLLSNSRRRGVDLLYCNMEHLLPLPLTPLTVSSCKPEQITSVSEDFPPVSLKEILQPESLQSKTRLLKTAEAADCSDSSSPIKVSDRMRNKKRRHRKPKQEGLHSDSDSDDGFVSLCKPRAAPQPEKEVNESSTSERKLRKTLTSEERARIIPVSQSLESIADFYDSLSYVDSSLCLHHDQSETNRDVSSISVIIKDGMTDDSRIETDKGSRATRDSLLQIQGAVEALSFHRCRAAVGDAWDSSQQLPEEPRKEVSAELSLPVAAHREGYTFNQDGLCQPQLVLQRRALLESLVGRGVFGNLTTRSAAALDYLPVIRTICRLEQLKEQCKVKRRFLHYLDVIHWGLDKSTLQLLAKDFPQSSDEGPK